MVLGLNRSRLRSDASGLFAVRPSPIKLIQTGDWATERGAVLFESNADLLGGFPGYADRGCRLENVRLVVTESYLLIDEGLANGFGLPIRWIEGTALVQHSGKSDSALRIFYRERGAPHCFTIRFGASRLGSRGVSRSQRVQQVLLSTGLTDRFAADAPQEPNFTLPWDQTREFESENAIWTGRATAPLQVGSENIASDVWLTTKSLIWGGGAGNGLNRIPLTLLMDLVSTRIKDRAGTPVVYISIGDARTGRFELPFIFDLHAPPDRNFRERGAFLVGLRSRGLPDGKPAATLQPWRIDSGSRASTEDDALDLGSIDDRDVAAVAAPDDAPTDVGGVARAVIRRLNAEVRPDAPINQMTEAHFNEPSLEPAMTNIEGAQGQRFTAVDSIEAPVSTLSGENANGAEIAGTTVHVTVEEIVQVVAEPWFVDLERPIVPLGENLVTAHRDLTEVIDLATTINQASLAAIIDAALNEIEVEKDSTEPFQTILAENDVVATPADDLLLAEWSVPEEVVVDESHDRELAESRSEGGAPEQVLETAEAPPVDQVISESIEQRKTSSIDVEVPTEGRVAMDLWSVVRRYEESALGALAEALRVIDDRAEGKTGPKLSESSPSSFEQAQAVAEIENLVANGIVSAGKGKTRRERLTTLGDVCVRLRTLIELYDSGFLTEQELETKRAKLVKVLSDALIP